MSLPTITLLFLYYVSRALATTPNVLVYSATAGFRHDSIPTALEALKSASSRVGVAFDATEDHTRFTESGLSQYDAIMFLSTTGEVLDDKEKEAFQGYLNAGGNFIGVHSAADCLVNTSFYGRQVGAFFDYHADLQPATVNVLDDSHPSTRILPRRWELTDEMYNFKSDPRSVGAKVILSADESTYTDNGTRKFDQGTPHPTAWYQEQGAGVQAGGTAGRSFYTSLGHLNETWKNELFVQHVLGGLSWVLESNTTRAFNAKGRVGSTGQAPSSTVSSTNSGTGTPVPSNIGILKWIGSPEVLIGGILVVVISLLGAYLPLN